MNDAEKIDEDGGRGGQDARPIAGWFFAWRWSLAVAALLALVVTSAVLHPELWYWLGVWRMEPRFGDLVAIFASGQAKVAGHDVYAINPFDPLGRPHVYGPWWLVTGPLGFKTEDAVWVGPILIGAYLGVALAITQPRGPVAAALTAAFLLSAPVMLGVERANNDLMIVVLLAAAAWVIGRGAGGLWSGAGLLVLASALKMYPIVALCSLGAARRRPLWILAAVLLALAACFGVLWAWHRDFARALSITPHPVTMFSYGFENLGLIWRSFAIWRPWFAWPLGAVGAGAGWLLWAHRRGLMDMMPLHGTQAAAYLCGAVSWIGCYAVSTSYPYRVTLLTLCLGLWLRMPKEAGEEEHRAGRLLMWLILAATWIASLKMWVGDLCQAETATTWGWMLAILGAEQALWLAVNLGILITLGGWAVRWLRRFH